MSIEVYIYGKAEKRTYTLPLKCEKSDCTDEDIAGLFKERVGSAPEKVYKTNVPGTKMSTLITTACARCYGRLPPDAIDAFVGVKKDDEHIYDITDIIFK